MKTNLSILLAEAGLATSPQAGTDSEELQYALREAASSEVEEFEGGETVVVSVSLLAILLIVLIVVLLSHD